MPRAAFLLLTLLGPGVPPASPAAPDVVLVTLDTVRADRMGFLGSTRGLTPALDALAREGVVFEQAFAQAPLTTVSHATILSGTYPPFHGVRDFGMPPGAEVPWLPALLRDKGYRWARALPHLTVAEPEPGFADARFTLGLAYASLGRREEAVEELRAALKADPRHRKASELLQRLIEGPSAPAPPR